MIEMVPMYGFGGGGGTGATMTVTAPVGATVTISKDGKSKTKVSGADGVAVFKGLATGDWTLTITDGVQTSAPQTVTVTADYSITMSFFAATINVTYPAGSTCTATDGTTTLTAPDTSGVWACTVPNAGTWTFSIGKSGWERIVTITESGQTENLTIDGVGLFDYGRQKYTWSAVAMRQSSSEQLTSGKPTLINNDDGSLTITLSKNSAGMYSGGLMTDTEIDFSGISTLSIEFEESKTVSDSANSSYLCVLPITASNIDDNKVAMTPLTGKTSPVSLYTTGVTGKYAVLVQININTYAVGTGSVSINIKRIIGR